MRNDDVPAMKYPDPIAVAEGLEEAAAQCKPEQLALKTRLEQGAQVARRAEKMKSALATINDIANSATVLTSDADVAIQITKLLKELSRRAAEGLQ